MYNSSRSAFHMRFRKRVSLQSAMREKKNFQFTSRTFCNLNPKRNNMRSPKPNAPLIEHHLCSLNWPTWGRLRGLWSRPDFRCLWPLRRWPHRRKPTRGYRSISEGWRSTRGPLRNSGPSRLNPWHGGYRGLGTMPHWLEP